MRQLYRSVKTTIFRLRNANSYTVESVSRKRPHYRKRSFRLNPKLVFFHIRKRAFLTTFSTERFDKQILSKNSVENVFLNPSHRLFLHKTHPHAHTPTHPYQVPLSSILQQHRSWLGCYHCCCSHRNSAWRIPTIAPPANSAYYTMAATSGIDAILSTTATPAVALAVLG